MLQQIICQLYNAFKNHNINLTTGYVFIVIAPLAKKEKVKYHLMQFTKIKMNLLEDYDDEGLTYERGSIILKVFFFNKPTTLKIIFSLKIMNLMSYVVNLVI